MFGDVCACVCVDVDVSFDTKSLVSFGEGVYSIGIRRCHCQLNSTTVEMCFLFGVSLFLRFDSLLVCFV